MARSDLVKALLRSYQQGDDRGFHSTAQSIIEDERRKRHDLLADQLEIEPPHRALGIELSL